MAFNWRDIFSGGSLTSFTPSTVNPAYPAGNVPVSAGGSGMHPGMESGYQPVYGVKNKIPQDISMSRGDPLLGGISNPRYSSVISTSTGAPDKRSWFDKFDPQALEDLAGLTPPERRQGKVLPAPGISRGGRQGGRGIPLSKEYDYTYAPNPGEVLYVPRREKDRFAGR